MATLTITSTCKTNPLPVENGNPELREPSFSSYLSTAEENFVRKLADSTYKPVTINVPQVPISLYQVSVGKGKTEDGEISIFGAEKYFNGAMDDKKTRIAEKGGRKTERVGKSWSMKSSKYGTPSTYSDLSWNSQNALLTTPSRHNRSNSKNIFAVFGCKCYCSDKKSIDVDDHFEENKSNYIEKKHFDSAKVYSKELIKSPLQMEQNSVDFPRKNQSQPEPWFKEEILTSPNTNPGLGNITIGRQFVENTDEEPRKSLDVFKSSSTFDKVEIGLNLQSKLLDWNENIIAEKNMSINIEMEDDIESDSSSDLFEIKNLSGNTHPLFKYQESDDLSTCMSPNSCYEPSEASIEWSVVTASAANFSVASYSGEQKSIMDNTTTKATKTASTKEVQRRKTSTLMGCKSSKAVKVVAEAHITPTRVKSMTRKLQKSDSLTKTTGTKYV